MCKIMEELKREGWEEGRAEGRAEGQEEVKVETALRILKSGKLSLAEIAGLVDLPLTKVQQLQAALSA